MQSVVKKYVVLDKLAEELAAKIGDIQAAYVIGDYAKGSDSIFSGQQPLVLHRWTEYSGG